LTAAVLAVRRRVQDGDHVLALAAVAFTVFAIAYPLGSARYPAMVDLPFHAAETAALRHYFDPAYHFREQFELRPLAVP
jgi:hypothetical protein